MKAPAWQRRLASRDSQLRPIPSETDIWGVFPGGDRRKRPLARVRFEVVKAARAEGLLRAVADDAYTLQSCPELTSARRVGDFQSQHRQPRRKSFILDNGRLENREINIAESPLARWAQTDPTAGKPFLSPQEFEAGERLRDDYNRSVLAERVTSDWDSYAAPARASGGRSREDASVSAQTAKDRVFAALEAVGPGLNNILVAICLRESGIEAAEREQGWSRRSGKTVLKIALQRLALHYGLLKTADLSR